MHYNDKYEYIRNLFAQETDALVRIRETTSGKNDQIYVYPEEGKLLQLLVQLVRASRIVEIGTLSGYSAMWMLQALPENGQLFCFERSEERAEMARHNLHDPRVRLIVGNALETLPTIEAEGPFDMVFIDADKLNYTRYLDWAERNIRKGGLICADNTLLFDTVWNEHSTEKVSRSALQAMREFNERLADTGKYTGLLLPTEEGFSIAIKNF